MTIGLVLQYYRNKEDVRAWCGFSGVKLALGMGAISNIASDSLRPPACPLVPTWSIFRIESERLGAERARKAISPPSSMSESRYDWPSLNNAAAIVYMLRVV